MRWGSNLGRIIAVCGTATWIGSCTSRPPVEDTAPAEPPAFVPGELLVKFKSTFSTQQVQSALALGNLQSIEYIADIDVHRCRVTSEGDVSTALQSYRANPSVEYAEPNYIYHASAIPDDPRFGELWAMQNSNDADIDAVEAWNEQRGSRDVLVAIVDTGVDYAHEDLRDNMWRNPGESGDGKETNGVDDDGNGFVDDVFGWDFVSNDNDPMDDNEHGSHVAGTIAAVGNNGTGVVGVNWNASIMALKFLDRNGSGQASDAIEAILYAARNGARVLNNSWGGGPFSQALKDAVEFARDHDALFVAAAGNEGRNNDAAPSYPASYEVSNVLSVAASDRDDRLAGFSNFGLESVDLAAPGADILSTTPGNRYQSFNGTSMATPHVSGVAALILAQNPGLGHRAVMVRLLSSVDRSAPFEGTTASGGRLNASAALSREPHVAFVTRLQDTPDTEGPYLVRAEATDDVGITVAGLAYQVDSRPSTTVGMTASAPGVFEAEIPGQPMGAVVSYFVQVADGDGAVGQSRTFQFQVTSGGNDAPPCGNMALTLPTSTPDPEQAAWTLLQAVLLLFGFWVVRRVSKRAKKLSHVAS